MNNDNQPHDSAAAPESNVPDAGAVIDQVRELLFGDHRRASEAAIKALEDRIAALNATVEARFADFERRLNEARAEGDSTREGHVAAIGSALTELGERLRDLVARPGP